MPYPLDAVIYLLVILDSGVFRVDEGRPCEDLHGRELIEYLRAPFRPQFSVGLEPEFEERGWHAHLADGVEGEEVHERREYGGVLWSPREDVAADVDGDDAVVSLLMAEHLEGADRLFGPEPCADVVDLGLDALFS